MCEETGSVVRAKGVQGGCVCTRVCEAECAQGCETGGCAHACALRAGLSLEAERVCALCVCAHVCVCVARGEVLRVRTPEAEVGACECATGGVHGPTHVRAAGEEGWRVPGCLC